MSVLLKKGEHMASRFSFGIVLIFLLSAVCGCAYKGNYQEVVKETLKKWNDANQVASSTSRAALGGPVARLQEIKRQAERLIVPEQEKDCYAYLIRYMDLTTKAYLEFMRKGDASQSTELSKKNWAKFYQCSSLFKEQRTLEAKAKAAAEQKAKIEEERKKEDQRARIEQLKKMPWADLKNEIAALSESELRVILGEPISITKLDDDNSEFDYERDGRKIQIYLSGGKVSGSSDVAASGVKK
jgi:hypothetical protein